METSPLVVSRYFFLYCFEGKKVVFLGYFLFFLDRNSIFPLHTVIQNTLKIGQEYSTVPRAQERVSERASERVSAVERASEVSRVELVNE